MLDALEAKQVFAQLLGLSGQNAALGLDLDEAGIGGVEAPANRPETGG